MFEIYLNAANRELLVEDLQSGEVVLLKKMPHEWLVKVDNGIKELYPKTYTKLCEQFGDSEPFLFARICQFLSCNCAEKNGVPDIDEHFNFKLETVYCPARALGICKLGFCLPQLTDKLSKTEITVLKLFCEGMSEEEIGERLFISSHTVHNHINNMYTKTGIKGMSNPDRRLVAYAHEKNLF